MANGTTHVRFSPEEKELIQTFADFEGTTVSALIRAAVLEWIGDKVDVRLFQEALGKDDGERIAWPEVKERLGL